MNRDPLNKQLGLQTKHIRAIAALTGVSVFLFGGPSTPTFTRPVSEIDNPLIGNSLTNEAVEFDRYPQFAPSLAKTFRVTYPTN